MEWEHSKEACVRPFPFQGSLGQEEIVPLRPFYVGWPSGDPQDGAHFGASEQAAEFACVVAPAFETRHVAGGLRSS